MISPLAALLPLLALTSSALASPNPAGPLPTGAHRAIYARQASASASASAAHSTTHRSSAAASRTTNRSASINTGVVTAIGTATTAEPTVPLATTFAPGATSPVKGAPVLPNAAALLPASYPTLDRVPSLTSPEVVSWLSKIDMSKVPNIPVTQPGGCSNASNSAAVAAAATNCWWTCGGCTRETDVTYCPNKGTWGTSYDDGPSPYTPTLLQFLDQHNLKTTFFIVGSRAISRPEMVQYEYMTGHQLSVHTWSHPALTTMSNEQIVAELGWTQKVIKDITGVTPITFRPPYGDIDDRVRSIASQMGLTPIIWTSSGGQTFDTQDWEISAGVVTTQQVVNNFNRIIGNTSSLSTGFIVLQHDLYQQAVDLAVQYVLPQALQRNDLDLMPIVECLGKTMEDAYNETKTDQANVIVGASGSGNAPGVTPTGSKAGTGAAVRTEVVSALVAAAGMVFAGATLLM